MTNRAANATIKGYLYQFDYSLLKILESENDDDTFVIEGAEDIDIHDADTSMHVQCKYYEGTDYNHSVIKEAIVAMLTAYHKLSVTERTGRTYHIYGFYKSGQNKLPNSIDVEFVKDNFLTTKKRPKKEKDEEPKEVIEKVHEKLGISDNTIEEFIKVLDINLNAESYDSQQSSIHKILKSINKGSCDNEIETIYYPRALTIITDLAKNEKEIDRTITRSDFLDKLPKKEIVFNQWLINKLDERKYNKSIKKELFTYKVANIPNETRIFLLDLSGEYHLGNVTSLLKSISDRFSNAEHKHTTDKQRFCPLVLMKGVDDENIKKIKHSLYRSSMIFSDGFPFKDSDFIIKELLKKKTKENNYKIRFIPSELEINKIIDEVESVVKIYDFYKESPIQSDLIPEEAEYKAIRINSVYSITEMIK
ncbi:TPA: hypothetical protein N2917_000708 [Vibrio parahaemolyticus]|uniref:DUF4297 family anti-phage-associated protein n=1 Tax=Vibrio parahaemolyticus TaxID=670 RepID=UPI001F314203|nr:DUF4297 family anti-phage-associated protein [Vibrio parahaemolyticus]MCG0031888.1 DUF4297 domain-containing protein [Vibrio parahaemolyticus]MCX8941847.1 DUF4297 domain-containing protein [Vibrio parahaemolyticus]HCM1472259.1 hypothetical protein [Vibrio parahaemolyticus]